ncbi:MAG: TM1812 family CRISPR-associated protein [Spirochaetales bacterium]|jgi:hypothetical protein|nr:TM1812 family CRISPR-associated protein [Spirochaetales bacterium]
MNKPLSEVKLTQSIEEAFIHLKRLLYAGNKIKSFFPLSEEFLLNIDEENIEHLDQYVFRFMKLQDCIGQRIFASLLENLQEDYSTKPFLDILNRLEQLGVIENAYSWQELRDIRNDITHEYPKNTTENTMALNELYIKTADLFAILRSTTVYIQKKLKMNVPEVPSWPPV